MTQGYIEKSISTSESDIEKINRFTKSELDEKSVYIFALVLCDNDIDRDFEKFSVDALYELAEGFVGKTGISDHSMKAENQKSRIFDAWVEKCEGQKAVDGEDLYQLRAKAYMLKSEENKSLIDEIEAGIKKEVSVSCSMAHSVCSICKNDKRSGKCAHIGGKEYSGKIAYTILDGVTDTYEFSFVAVPAQRGAGVTKAYHTESEDMTVSEIIEKIKSCDEELILTKTQAEDIAKEFERLSEDAELGRQYKKSLCDEVVSLCANAMPEMDIKTFSGVAQVMTTKELLSFKKAFIKVRAAKDITPQLKSCESTGKNNSQFKI
ncbi:MAG: hypothetical protein IJ851_06375 [Eubacterium sp.]|nr:hypothetical protein [Eubacterium sp.]